MLLACVLRSVWSLSEELILRQPWDLLHCTWNSHLKYLRCIKTNGCPTECHVGLWSGVQGEAHPPSPVHVQSPPLMGTPDQLRKGMFLVCWVCDLHFVFIVFTIINLKTNQCAYTGEKKKKKQLSNVSCRSSDSCIHGFIHSAPFVGFVSDFYSFIFFVGFYLFLLSLYFNSTWKLVIVYIIDLVVGELHQLLYSKLCGF